VLPPRRLSARAKGRAQPEVRPAPGKKENRAGKVPSVAGRPPGASGLVAGSGATIARPCWPAAYPSINVDAGLQAGERERQALQENHRSQQLALPFYRLRG